MRRNLQVSQEKKIEFMWGLLESDRIGRIWWFGLQDADTGGSPNKEDLATSTSDQELDAGNSGVALLLLTQLPMSQPEGIR